MNVSRIAIVGFGSMGAGIAQVFAQAGFSVMAVDMDENVLRKGMETIVRGPFGLQRLVEKGRLTEDQMHEIVARITTTTDLSKAASSADFVVEAVFEDLHVKTRVFKDLDEHAPSHAVLASNTSTLSITSLAATTSRPDKVVGMHFFNPPQVMKLVEVVRGLQTSEGTVELVKELATRLGKTPVTCVDVPGFIANRIGVIAILEAIRLYEQGSASAQDIDTAMKLGYNWPMGPLELADLIGLDVLLKIAEVLHKEIGNPAYHPPALLTRLVAAGYLGRKSGRGFYNY